MDHIPDGVLSAPVLIGGAVAALAALAIAVRRLDYARVPQAAVLSAAFFVASLISVPIGPSSVHLVLNGLMGLVLGWTAVPAILVGLVLQAVFFGFGGLLVLGVNTFNVALPALVVAALLGRGLRRRRVARPFLLGATAGGLGVLMTGAMICLSLALSSADFLSAARIIVITYLPLAVAEAAVTGFCVAFLLRVAPEMLACPEPAGA